MTDGKGRIKDVSEIYCIIVIQGFIRVYQIFATRVDFLSQDGKKITFCIIIPRMHKGSQIDLYSFPMEFSQQYFWMHFSQ